ncbi:GNAT family N-acetyltransferase [Uliginosibacterium paludis]|uniref:GNAT family N-acetyltransferase n=1 Tax=Uliginosibacterium paludis TaxID=1615952 RepID=A0ABV2CQ53_9RHOO
MPEFELIDVCTETGAIAEAGWLAAAEPVHRQLRPSLPPDYLGKMQRVFAGGGRMSLATQESRVVGLAVWRVFEDTYNGVKFYVDDLVTDEAHRSSGAGKALMALLARHARHCGADGITLDSGVQRHRAHAFYFREGFSILSHNFKKQLV